MKGAPSRRHGDSAASYARRRDAQALRVDLAEWDAESEVATVTTVGDWLAELALLHLMTNTPVDDGPVSLVLRGVDELGSVREVHDMARMYQSFFYQLWGVTARLLEPPKPDPEGDDHGVFRASLPVRILFLEGPFVRPFTQEETGILLLRSPPYGFNLVRVDEREFASVDEAQVWLDKHVPGIPGSTVDNPDLTSPILRAFDMFAPSSHRGRGRARFRESDAVADYRTGLTLPQPLSHQGFRSLLLSRLPLPPELDPP